MTNLELQTDLHNSLTDAQTLVKQQISAAFIYLREAQSFSLSEIKALADDVLSEVTSPPAIGRRVVCITAARAGWVN